MAEVRYPPRASSSSGCAVRRVRYFFFSQLRSFPCIPVLGVRVNPVSYPTSASITALLWFTHIPMPKAMMNGRYLMPFHQGIPISRWLAM